MSNTSANKKTLTKDPAREQVFNKVKINWLPAAVLLSTPIIALFLVPWYLWTHSVSWQVWAVFAFFMAWNGLSITAGYHRLWSHRTYKTALPVRIFLLIGATLATQSSAFDWCSGHRDHHRYVDDIYEDPYSAKRGFWFSHMGWMLKNYPSSVHDFKNIPDLTSQKMLRIQHDHYGLWVVVTNIGLPALFGWMVGDVWGALVLAGLLRLVLSHHFTFFINSLAHMWGSQPYTDENTARDNPWLAIFTWGEGYHNYHHIFQYDYRNGVKWWQYDPTKWLIAGLAKLGLASNLRRVPTLNIKQAEVTMSFKRAKKRINKRIAIYGHDIGEDLAQFKAQVQNEYDAFSETLENWRKLKEQAIEMKKNEFAQKLNEVDERLKDDFKAIEARMQEHGKRLELAVAQFKGQLKTAS